MKEQENIIDRYIGISNALLATRREELSAKVRAKMEAGMTLAEALEIMQADEEVMRIEKSFPAILDDVKKIVESQQTDETTQLK